MLNGIAANFLQQIVLSEEKSLKTGRLDVRSGTMAKY
jgi:hypothetical protein